MLNRLLAKSSKLTLLLTGAGSGMNATTGATGSGTGAATTGATGSGINATTGATGSITGAAITGSATLTTVGIGASRN